MKCIKGIVGSKGLCGGKAVVFEPQNTKPIKYGISDSALEEARFREAQSIYKQHLEKTRAQTADSVGEAAAEIFEAYLIILGDEAFFKKALKRIEPEKTNIEYLVYDECKKVLEVFDSMEDIYLKERGVDISNVCHELINIMLGRKPDTSFAEELQEDIILVAEDLTPSQTMKIDKKRLKGFITEKGGATSHTVLLAKALDIPAIVGVKGLLDEISCGDELLLDAFVGVVTICPDEETIAGFKQRCEQELERKVAYDTACNKEAVTLDGYRLNVSINSGDSDSIKAFDSTKSDGVGLFRTEFLYMNRPSYPDEEAQFTVYKEMAERANGKEVIIRTLDIGGDKQVEYMDLPCEDNPFLGYRAIRLCLDRMEVFHTQLRSILRASAYGNVKIMFPMIVTMEELLTAKRCVKIAAEELKAENVDFNENIQIGIMIETPAAVLLSDRLAKESDFFSIGSNDLIQYTTATDRMNGKVQYLYDSCNLSVLRAIRMVSQNAKSAGIPWHICGEVAGEERLIPLWVALGVNELSVAPSQVGRVKHMIRKIDRSKIAREIEKLFDMSSIDEAKAVLDEICYKFSKPYKEGLT